MKKIHLTCVFILFSMMTFAQNWKPYKIDDSVQVSLPTGFERKDTLGQTLINAKSSFGNVLITVSPDNPRTTPDIEKENHLQKYYEDFVTRIKESSKDGSILNEKDTLMGKLHVRDLTLAVDSGSGKQLRNIRILHENSSTYTFQFLYQEIHKEYADPESATFFNSIKIPPDAAIQTQFTNPENTTGKTPTENNTVYIGIGIALLILILLFFILKKPKRD